MKKGILKLLFFCLFTLSPLLNARADLKFYRNIEGHRSSVSSTAFSPDSKLVATAGFDSQIRITDINTGKMVLNLIHGAMVESVVFSPDGRQIASAARDRTVKLWDAKTGRLLKTFSGAEDMVFSAYFSADSKYLCFGSLRKVEFILLGDYRRAFGVDIGDIWARTVKFSPDNRYFLMAGGRKITLWEVSTGDFISTLTGRGGLKLSNPRDFDFGTIVYSADFSIDSQLFAATGDDGSVKVWRVEDGLSLWKQQVFSGLGWHVAFSGNYLAAAGRDKTVNFFDATTGKALFSANACADEVYSVAFSGNGRLMAIACKDASASIWKIDKKSFGKITKDVKTFVYVSGTLGILGLILISAFVFRK
ncbi:MAG TPA: WD40 repeat domain-containing protein, partial [Candidatus Goldiibacteriota bacterium]|nr:WD40 repeat domain-containing protein [Candidatus Goldiibacteriota bacterium]